MHNETKAEPIKTLFLDIGGVLLTNGWGQTSRKKAVEKFGLDGKEIEERHHLTFDTYEEGKLSLDEYLGRVVFNEPKNFSKEEFKAFMFEQSQPLGDNLTYFKALKKQHNLKVIAVSNEGRELNEHRIKQYKLNELFDAYISSCYIHLRKPDKGVLRMACDISQTLPEHALYIDDRLMFVEVAAAYGLQALQFKDLETTKDFINTCTFHKSE
ncbi:MAG: HAD hydrolase-like protein [Flavipsychrobacter sp.]|nr:HAD hydrolase-like protein [Flavipsychrobacter sp.]